MSDLDWRGVGHAVAGAIGAAAVALVVGVAMIVQPERPPGLTRRLVLEGLASMAVGAASAFYLAPAIAAQAGLVHPSAASAVGFLTGVVAWRGLPLAIVVLERAARGRSP